MSAPKPERRRRRVADDGEEVSVEDVPAVTRSSECESEGEGPDIEYESTVDDSADQDETEDGSETETETETEEGTGSETEGYTDEEGLEEERQSGDGQEQPETDKPDDDEDKKNPAYVPRKGAFYEHDLRQGEEGPEAEVTDDPKLKKKLWQDEGKWAHDRYNDDMQAPKSRQELIELYGYDIRSADRPPEAAPGRTQRAKGPRKPHFSDFMPRMAVIDTTDDGLDTLQSLGEDELIEYTKSLNRRDRKGKVHNTDTKRRGRGRGRGSYHDNDVENKNRQNNTRTNQESFRNNEVPVVITRDSDFPSIQESARQIKPRDGQGWRKEDKDDRNRSNMRPNNDRAVRLYQQSETPDSSRREEYREDNRGRFQQSQDIRRQEENRRGGYSHSRGRGTQEESWRSAQNEFRDGHGRRDDYYNRDGRGGQQCDQGYNRRRQNPQQSVPAGNRAPRIGTSGDAGGSFGNSKFGGGGYEQQQQQQQNPSSEITGAAKEYTNSSYKYPDTKMKQKGVPSSAASAASGVSDGAGDSSTSSNSKNVVISNKENVQTINVTITSTTTEKKSYAKERRAKGVSRPVDGSVMAGGTEMQAPAAPLPGKHYQGLPPAGVHMDVKPPSVMAAAAVTPYSHLQQGMFAEPPPVGAGGTKLYNPSLPPPSFYQREHGGLAPGQQRPAHTPPGNIQDPNHFSPALLPPTTALPFGLPVSSTGIPLPPTAAGIPANPALFQPPAGPPAPSSIPAPATAMLAAPFLPAGMMYGGGSRVPPPGAATPFPITLAYTSPPPQVSVPAAVVGSQPPPQGTAPAQGIPTAAQHKKVYRGDITYYAPELQQPSRTPQKRPKAAIPIIDPQEIPRSNVKLKSELSSAQENPSVLQGGYLPGNDAAVVMNQTTHSPASSAQVSSSRPTLPQKNQFDKEQEFEIRHRPPVLLLKGASTVDSQASAALGMVSASNSGPYTPAKASFSSQVIHTSSPNVTEGPDTNRTAVKIDLSPGGPPVSSCAPITPTGRDADQLALCAAMQQTLISGVKAAEPDSSINSSSSSSRDTRSKQEVDASFVTKPELKQEVLEKPIGGSSESSVT